MSNYTAVELDKLPVPDSVDALDYATIRDELVASLRDKDPDYDTLAEADPGYKLLEIAAYREYLLRNRINTAVKSVMLAYAAGADLDNLSALPWINQPRKVISEAEPDATPPIPAVLESDDDYRRRIQLSVESISTAGPEGAYIFHALSAHELVKDASADSPAPCEVTVTVLLSEPQPSESVDNTDDTPAEVLAAVDNKLNDDSIRPLTDQLTVRQADLIDYEIDATLYFQPGPDRQIALEAAQNAIDDYIAANFRLGNDIELSGIYAALHQPGVQRVDLRHPTASIQANRQQAARCVATTVIDGGVI